MSKRYQCTECSRGTDSSLDFARTLGWRIWEGESVTGRPLKVRLCPFCAGGHAGEEPPEEPSWRVGCRTCDWEYEDDYDDGPLSEKEAHRMATDHECERDTWVRPPKTLEELAKEQLAGVSR